MERSHKFNSTGTRGSGEYNSQTLHILHRFWRRHNFHFVPIIVALLLCLPGVEMVHAQNWVTFTGNTTHCGDECCFNFHIDLVHGADSLGVIRIDLNPGTQSDSCIDIQCWYNQGGGWFITNHDANGGPNEFDITFVHSIAPKSSVDVFICGPKACLDNFTSFNWYDNTSMVSNHKENVPLTNCDQTQQGCGGCSSLWGWPAGANDTCYGTICFQSGSIAPLCSFTLNFNPPLTDCQISGLNPRDGKRPLCYGKELQVDSGIFGLPTDWKDSAVPGTGNITFYSDNPGACFTNYCMGFCFDVPNCDSIPRTVKVVEPDSGCGVSFTTPLKFALGGSVGIEPFADEQNYPNPLEASTGFKTSIPFTTTASGTAFIRIFDVKGNTILSDNREASYAGKHFFYFTGNDLPSGTYYYQIEFPKGIIIQSKTMLIIR